MHSIAKVLATASTLIGSGLSFRPLPDPNTIQNSTLGGPTRFVVEFSQSGSSKFRKRDGSPSKDTEGFYDQVVKDTGSQVVPGLNLTSELFHGTSFTLSNATNEVLDAIESLPEVEHIWPISTFRLPVQRQDNETSPPSGWDFSQWHPHLLTNVLDAHEIGLDGSGVVVAIVDTGVDYRHPALGGGIGPGYKIESGWDFVGPNWDPSRPDEVSPNDDPMDCQGHGTHVAGIVGSSRKELPGVAPKVTMRAYKVFSCPDVTFEDIIIQAFLRAYEEGADIISGSLGSDRGYAESALANVITRIVEKGTFVVTAAGNSGDMGPYFTSNTANSYGGLAVGSASVKHQLAYEIIARSSSGESRVMEYVASDSRPWNRTGNFTVYMPKVPRDFNVCMEDLPSDFSVPTDAVLLLPRGWDLPGCDENWGYLDTLMMGVANWVMYYNYQNKSFETPKRTVYRDDQAEGFASLNYDDGIWLEEQDEAGHSLHFEFSEETKVNDRSAAFVSYFSSWGTTLDARLKPEIAGPGDEVLSTFISDSIDFLPMSGTSMATPYIAGVAALFFQSAGGRSKICGNPAVVAHRRIVASGQSIHNDNLTDFGGAIGQQGAGLVDALKVVNYTTAISPVIINLNDTTYFQGVHTIEIKNRANFDVTYEISHEHSSTVRSRELADAYIDNFPILKTDQGLASVELSTSKITVPSKGKASFTVTFQEPTDIDPMVLAQYGGYIHIVGSNGEALKATYLGVKGSLGEAQVWETQHGVPIFLDADNTQFESGRVFPFPTLPKLYFNVLWSTREFSFDVVHADWAPSDWVYPPVPGSNKFVGSTVFDDFGFKVSFPQRFTPRSPDNLLLTLLPQYAHGASIESGEYRILSRYLKTYGDYGNVDDWVIRLSNTFVVGESE
ncbi:Peptidase [Paramyrothecium foliicola]|nr:Peptidase [Paramyrothecium foliicola]